MESKDKKTTCSRRGFMGSALKAGAALPAAVAAAHLLEHAGAPGHAMVQTAMSKEAPGVYYTKKVPYFKKLKNKKIQCEICPRKCIVGDRERGYCGNKENRGGTYYTLAWGNPCAAHNDPIEKKPLFHFLPGTDAFSIACAGCNFDCKFCQNWDISQSRPEQTQNLDLPPSDVAAYAKQVGARSIACTYGEPVVFYKYMYDCAVAGRKQGIRSVMISNGYIEQKPLKALLKKLDAVKIDFKAYTNDFYKKTCSGTLKPVLSTMETIAEKGVWMELVYLVVPTLNDGSKDLKAMAKWIHKNLGANTPIHFSRFQPQYKLKNLPPTPLGTLEKARDICQDAGLGYVYIGNVPGHDAENTYCHKCGKLLLSRYGYLIKENKLSKGKCKYCKTKIPGVWS